MELAEVSETASVFSHPSASISSMRDTGARTSASPVPTGSSVNYSCSEDLDVMSVDAENTNGFTDYTLSPCYEELLDVVTRAVTELNIDCPANEQKVKAASKLDKRFFKKRAQPQRLGLPFFPDLHQEVIKLWKITYSSRHHIKGYITEDLIRVQMKSVMCSDVNKFLTPYVLSPLKETIKTEK